MKSKSIVVDLCLQFAFPWLLTTLHCSFVTVGCYVLLALGTFKLTKLSTHDNLVLVAFSFLFTINIAISTVSLYVPGSYLFIKNDSLEALRTSANKV